MRAHLSLPAAVWSRLSKGAGSPELKVLGEDLLAHENALRDWMQSELDGKSDGAEKIFAYLERHGITREEAATPRERREDVGGDTQKLVLAFFPTEDGADEAAKALKKWEKASEYMKVDAIGVLVKDKDGKVKQHKLGKQAGKRGMGIGVALGLIAAIPTGGLPHARSAPVPAERRAVCLRPTVGGLDARPFAHRQALASCLGFSARSRRRAGQPYYAGRGPGLRTTTRVLVIARLLAGVGPGQTSIGWRASAVGGLAAFVLAVGVLSGCAAPAGVSSGGSADASGHDDADVAFATAMVPHHAQAVAMTRLALDHAGSAEVKELARQMAAEQLPEIVQLRGLLSEWGRLPAPGAPGMPDAPGMQGMSGMHDGTTAAQAMSAGMMTDQQMRDLSTASGPAFDRLFLRMMIKHHGGAVAMAAAELSDGENADAQLLAQNISDSQQAQVTVMLQMLADG